MYRARVVFVASLYLSTMPQHAQEDMCQPPAPVNGYPQHTPGSNLFYLACGQQHHSETTKPITFPLSSSAIFEPSHKILTSSKLFCMNNSFLIGKSSPISRFQSATRASRYSLFHAVISNTHSPLSLDISTISNIPQ